MKTIIKLLTVVTLASALPLAKANPPMSSDSMAPAKPGMDGMASSGMGNMKSDSMKMGSDNMMNAMSPPKVGSMASDFMLKTLDDQSVRLGDLTAKSDVILVVLRGWPGYQCPACAKQTHDFVRNAEKLQATGARVVMVYPGPADDLKAHATEFLQDKDWPQDFTLVLDPDYSFTKAYGLRWDAPNETAYPSTFIINKEGKVTYAHVSKDHGDRVGSDAVLKAMKSSMAMSKPMM